MAQKKDLEYYLVQARRIAEHREAGAEEAIRKEFQKLLKDLKSYIGDVHAKYAADDGTLSFADLQKAGYNARFLEEIEKRIGVATPEVAKELHALVEDTYEMAYKSMIEGVEKVSKGADLGETFEDAVAITPEQIKNAVDNPYMEVALAKNHKTIIYDIRQIVATGLMNGDRYNTIAKKITVALDKETGPYKNAVLIARTEAHRVREAGNNDAAVAVDKELQGGTTDMRMTKTWRTMKDERVRPQYVRKKKKGGWSKGFAKKGANHMILEGQVVLADENFDLKDGNTAPCPGSSGIAAHDCNDRCYASFEMMTDAEFYQKTGRHFPKTGPTPEELAIGKEMQLMSDQMKLKADCDAAEKAMQQIDQKQFVNIWKNPVTAKDYEALKDRLPAKLAYFQANGKQDMIDLCNEFEDAGKKYLLAKDKYTTLSKALDDVNDSLKAARLELMKARGIDPKKMQKEIDDLTAKIAALKTPVKKKIAMGTKVKNYDQQQLKETLKYVFPYADDGDLDDLLKKHADSTLKGLIDSTTYAQSKKKAFKQKLEQLASAVTTGDPAEIAKLERQLSDMADELAKVMKRYGLEDDKFSKVRKDKAYWFTGTNAKERGDDLLRPLTGSVWQSAPYEERHAIYKYTSGSGSFNRPLRGYDGGWYNFKGVGKVDLDNEGSGAAIKHMTDIINKSQYNFDIWLQRGVESDSGAASFLGISEKMLNASEADLQQMLLGKVLKDEAFTSTAAAKGSGFSGRLILNIYAPKGTKMVYAEPFSHYGYDKDGHMNRTNGVNWDGVSKSGYLGSEFEVILQRGTSFKITKLEKVGSRLYVDVDVVGQ